jgi:hypothetical protein
MSSPKQPSLLHDAPSHSLKYLNVNLKVKTTKKGVKVHSLVRNTLGVKGCVRALRWGLKQVIRGSIIHKDLHKPKNKLVNA